MNGNQFTFRQLLLRNVVMLLLLFLTMHQTTIKAQSKDTHTKEKRSTFNKILNFIPSVGHFNSGQWRKGASDIWNTISILWFIAEPNAHFRKMEEDIGYYEPGTRNYVITSRNLEIERDMQKILLSMVVLNYVNSVIDCFNSKNDESFFSAFFAMNMFHYNTYITMANGYMPIDVTKAGPYVGFNFGYRSIFEFYAKMFFPSPGRRMQYAHFYTDYIIPLKSKRDLEFYMGLGFNAGGYDAKDIQYGGGLGLYPRVGASYILKENHYFRFNIAPYMFWNEIITKDTTKSDMDGGYYDMRFSRQPFGDNFGFEFIYRYEFSKRLFIQAIFDFSNLTEPAGDFINHKEDKETFIHRNKESSQMLRFDFSMNYKF